jgi:hypothetical protein
MVSAAKHLLFVEKQTKADLSVRDDIVGTIFISLLN